MFVFSLATACPKGVKTHKHVCIVYLEIFSVNRKL